MATEMPQRIPSGGVDLSHLAQRGAVAPAGPAGQAPAGAPAPGAPQTVDVPSLVLDVTDAAFGQIAPLSAVVPIVFDLWGRVERAEQGSEPAPREGDPRARRARVARSH